MGLDFGTLSIRAVVIDSQDGRIVATAVAPYRHGVIDRSLPGGEAELGDDWALQDPRDWLDSLVEAVTGATKQLAVPEEIGGVGISFTSCTVLPVTADGTPLCWLAEYQKSAHAWPKLWKHHAAQKQAERVTARARERGERWLARYGGVISSEWLLPKALQILEEAPAVYQAADLIVEGADWIGWQLGGRLLRNSCAAGFKGTWYQPGRAPDEDFLASLHPLFTDFYQTKARGSHAVSGTEIGPLQPRWARRLGLRADAKVAVGMIDAHAGALGAGLRADGTIYLAMGTSTCHMMIAEHEVLVDGISGIVEGGIVAGCFAYEAGQAAVGDSLDWVARHVGQSHEELTAAASGIAPGSSGLLALDWWNGCRTPLVDAELGGLILGYSLRTTAAEVYRAVVEATAFGTRLIIDSFVDAGLAVGPLRVGGGLINNELVISSYASITGREVQLCPTEHASALGAAMLGAVAAGHHPSLARAVEVIAPEPERRIAPDPAQRTTYDALFAEYCRLVDLLGRREDSPLRRVRAMRAR